VKATPAVAGRATQVEVKRRWPDGSAKHAIVTVDMPEMEAGAALSLPITQGEAARRPAAADPKADLAGLADVTATFRIHNGPTVSASLKQAAAGEPLRTWLAGPLVREYHFKAVPADTKGKADPDLEVHFRLRCYPGASTARVAVVVENTKWTAPGAVPYDVVVRSGQQELFSRRDVGAWEAKDNPRYAEYRGHVPFTRWIKRFWLGRALDDVHVHHDVKHLVATGLLPPYDPEFKIPEKSLASTGKFWAGSFNTQILQRGMIMAYFPTTGGRGDIGPLPLWATQYVLSQDPRARAATWGNGDLSGSCPVHRRDPKTDWYISLDEHPGFSLNNRGTTERVKPRATDETPWILAKGSYFSVDAAHQPSLAYVPYLFGGDYYHFEEMCFWANHNMIAIHQQYREREKGLLKANQTRGQAWTMRNLLHAAALAPDDSKEQAYFEAKLADNLAYYKSIATAPGASPLGLYGGTYAYTRGWPRGWNNRYVSVPPWQHNFLAWAMAHCVDQGYVEAAPFRDYLMAFTTGVVTHPDQITPHAGASYFLFIGERQPDKSVKMAATWKEVSELTYNRPGPSGALANKPPTRTRGNYAGIMRGVLICAVRAGRPEAMKAYRWVDSQFKHSDPMWAFQPPAAQGE